MVEIRARSECRSTWSSPLWTETIRCGRALTARVAVLPERARRNEAPRERITGALAGRAAEVEVQAGQGIQRWRIATLQRRDGPPWQAWPARIRGVEKAAVCAGIACVSTIDAVC